MGYVTSPQAQGQIVEYSYCDAGLHGVVERCHDRSDRSTTYRVYRWRAGAPETWEPWNGDSVGAPHTWRRGRLITEEEANRLTDRELW